MPVAIPPDPLLTRVGIDADHHATRAAREDAFAWQGEGVFRDIDSVAPRSPATVLDFGCGSGRVTSWWLRERPRDTIVGCDIHRPSIEWMRDHYPQRVRLYANDPLPPLPEENDSFDLVYCGSVFSHLTDWAPWLLELARVLKPGGALVASLHGRGFWPLGVAGGRGEPWDDDATGVIVERPGESFATSWGPAVYVSEWWLRRHWGLALDIDAYHSAGFGLPDARHTGQAWVVARKRPGPPPSAEAIAAISDDTREVPSLERALRLAHAEIAEHHLPEIRRLWAAVQESSKAWGQLDDARREIDRLRSGHSRGLLGRLARR